MDIGEFPQTSELQIGNLLSIPQVMCKYSGNDSSYAVTDRQRNLQYNVTYGSVGWCLLWMQGIYDLQPFEILLHDNNTSIKILDKTESEPFHARGGNTPLRA